MACQREGTFDKVGRKAFKSLGKQRELQIGFKSPDYESGLDEQ